LSILVRRKLNDKSNDDSSEGDVTDSDEDGESGKRGTKHRHHQRRSMDMIHQVLSSV
jgi:hypothetical protein